MSDPLDVLSLDDAKTAINMELTNTDHDYELARQITAISRLMDRMVGPVVQRSVTELHETDGETVILDWSPVDSIGSVLEDQGTGSIGTLTAHSFGGTVDGYYAEPDWRGGTFLSGVLQRRWTGRQGAWPHRAEVQVTYTAGRYADTASVDARFAECASEILRRLWKREAGTWAQASSFFETLPEGQAAPSPGFYKVAKPRIEEMLADQQRLPGSG